MGDHRWIILGGRGATLALVCWAGAAASAIAAGPESPADVSVPGSTAPRPMEAGAAVNVEIDGTATPGSRVRLRIASSVRPGSHYLWYQLSGPPVEISRRTEPELKLTVPQGADELTFLLVIGDERGLKESSVTIPIVGTKAPSAQPSGFEEARADAGDDQIGLVGRRITLNGSASTPANALDYRWLQVSGPELVPVTEAGRFLTFTPRMPGRYQFGLFVSHNNRIANPDFVNVDVGQLSGSAPAAMAPTPTPTIVPVSSPSPMTGGSPLTTPGSEIDTIVATALIGLDDSLAIAGPLAEAFEATASRLDLYRTAGDFLGEFSRRVDVILPKDQARRARWNSTFFEPLTRYVVAQWLTTGLDLRSPAGFAAPLNDPQKQELRRVFQYVARKLGSTGRATR